MVVTLVVWTVERMDERTAAKMVVIKAEKKAIWKVAQMVE